MSEGKLLFLGTGASTGIPVIGCSCKTCTSENPKDKRLRTSALIRCSGKSILIDSGPDIRRQALAHHITTLDGLILTHTHFDHIGGLEELRTYNFIQKAPISCLLSQESLNDLKQLFFYIFSEKMHGKNFTSEFDFQLLSQPSGEVELNGLPVRYFTYSQGEMKVLGLRFGDLAYFTDIKQYTNEIFEFLKGVSTLVISALRFTPSHLHLTIDEAIDFVKQTGVNKSYFIHLSHEIEHEYVESLLPTHVHLAYDGLEIPFHFHS